MLDRQLQNAINQSVQTADVNLVKQPTEANIGGDFWGYIEHPDIIAPWGTKERDRQLRRISYRAHNGLFQGAVAGLIMRVQATPWEVQGGRNNANYFQAMLQNSDFHDWETWVARLLWDFFTQDFGAVAEIIGGGKADKPISGRVIGLAHMDALSCYATKVQQFPLLYWNEEDNSRHLMHASRVYRMTDMVSPKRLAYGTGFSALSRYISEANVDILLGRHDNEMLNDLPPAGLLAISGMMQDQWRDAQRVYEADRRADGENVFRGTMIIHAIDPAIPIKLDAIPFSSLPENFDQKAFIDIHVNKLALALGVDPQDIWPLSGQALGTGTQSKVLDNKARGKMFGRVLQMITRFINRAVLPKDLEFAFKFKDTEADLTTATTAKMWVDIAAAATFLSDEEKRRLLVDNVEAFEEVLLDDAGELIELPDDDPKPTDIQEVVAPDDIPNSTPTNAPSVTQDDTTNTQQPSNVPRPGGLPNAGGTDQQIRERSYLDAHVGGWPDTDSRTKDYPATKDAFVDDVAAAISDASTGEISKAAFAIRMRAALSKYGRAAYLDGLADGGVEATALEGTDSDTFAGILAAQSSYVTDARAGITDFGGDAKARAQMWGNKSLQLFYDAGLISSDKNGMYEWVYGDTEHCDDCRRLNGQKHRLKDWHSKGWLPKDSKLECKGFNCECQLKKTTGRARGSY